MTAGRNVGDVVDRFRAVVEANVAGTVELLVRVEALVRRVVAEHPTSPPDGADVLDRLVDAGLSSYAEVSRHVLALLDGLVSVAERALLPGAAEGVQPVGAAGVDPAVAVRMDGRPGERVPCPFVVQNEYDRPVEVTFRAGPLSAPGRPKLPASAVTFEPTRMRIEARAADVATATIALPPQLVPGDTYVTRIEMVGLEGRRVGVALTVVEADRSAEVTTLVPTSARSTDRARPPQRRSGGAAR